MALSHGLFFKKSAKTWQEGKLHWQAWWIKKRVIAKYLGEKLIKIFPFYDARTRPKLGLNPEGNSGNPNTLRSTFLIWRQRGALCGKWRSPEEKYTQVTLSFIQSCQPNTNCPLPAEDFHLKKSGWGNIKKRWKKVEEEWGRETKKDDKMKMLLKSWWGVNNPPCIHN